MNFKCERTAEGMRLNLSSHEGSYPAWWKEVHVEIYGFTPSHSEVYVNEKKISADIDGIHRTMYFVLEDDGKGEVIEIK